MNEQIEQQNLDVLVKTYLTLRGEREKLAAEFDAKDRVIKDDMTLIEQAMLAICNSTNADSIKTSQGTVMRGVKERYDCNDWSGFKDFILEHQAVDLLQRRIHQSNFKSFLSEHTIEAEGLPPGVSIFRELNITVRKPTSR
jgi:hypothetical protein